MRRAEPGALTYEELEEERDRLATELLREQVAHDQTRDALRAALRLEEVSRLEDHPHLKGLMRVAHELTRLQRQVIALEAELVLLKGPGMGPRNPPKVSGDHPFA